MTEQLLTPAEFEARFGPSRVFNSYGRDVAAASPYQRWTLNLDGDGSIVAIAAGSDCNFIGWCVTTHPAVTGEEIALFRAAPDSKKPGKHKARARQASYAGRRRRAG